MTSLATVCLTMLLFPLFLFLSAARLPTTTCSWTSRAELVKWSAGSIGPCRAVGSVGTLIGNRWCWLPLRPLDRRQLLHRVYWPLGKSSSGKASMLPAGCSNPAACVQNTTVGEHCTVMNHGYETVLLKQGGEGGKEGRGARRGGGWLNGEGKMEWAGMDTIGCSTPRL